MEKGSPEETMLYLDITVRAVAVLMGKLCNEKDIGIIYDSAGAALKEAHGSKFVDEATGVLKEAAIKCRKELGPS